MSLEECCTYSQSAGQEGSRAIRLSLPRGTFWALPVASWGDTCSMFIAFPQQKWTELCEGHAYHSSRNSMEAGSSLSSEIQIHYWGAFRDMGCEEWCNFPGASKLGSGRGRFYWYLAFRQWLQNTTTQGQDSSYWTKVTPTCWTKNGDAYIHEGLIPSQ